MWGRPRDTFWDLTVLEGLCVGSAASSDTSLAPPALSRSLGPFGNLPSLDPCPPASQIGLSHPLQLFVSILSLVQRGCLLQLFNRDPNRVKSGEGESWRNCVLPALWDPEAQGSGHCDTWMLLFLVSS